MKNNFLITSLNVLALVWLFEAWGLTYDLVCKFVGEDHVIFSQLNSGQQFFFSLFFALAYSFIVIVTINMVFVIQRYITIKMIQKSSTTSMKQDTEDVPEEIKYLKEIDNIYFRITDFMHDARVFELFTNEEICHIFTKARMLSQYNKHGRSIEEIQKFKNDVLQPSMERLYGKDYKQS